MAKTKPYLEVLSAGRRRGQIYVVVLQCDGFFCPMAQAPLSLIREVLGLEGCYQWGCSRVKSQGRASSFDFAISSLMPPLRWLFAPCCFCSCSLQRALRERFNLIQDKTTFLMANFNIQGALGMLPLTDSSMRSCMSSTCQG
jgi:hypothetical protein